MNTETDKPPSVTAEQLIKAFITIRDQKTALTQDYEEEKAKLNAKLDKIKRVLRVMMEQVGSDNLSSHGVGTAYREVVQKFSATDWTSVWAHIQETGNFDLLQKRLGENACKAYLEETGELPPGVDLHQEYDIVVRRK